MGWADTLPDPDRARAYLTGAEVPGAGRALPPMPARVIRHLNDWSKVSADVARRLWQAMLGTADAVNAVRIVERKLGGINNNRSEERRVGEECRSRWSPDP